MNPPVTAPTATTPRRLARRSGTAAALAVGAALCLVEGCDRSPVHPASPAPDTVHTAIYTSFYPTTYFAQRITAGAVPVVCPCPADADPIFWQPSREEIARYQSASLIILNGAEYEKWAASVSLPQSRVIETARPFAAEFITFKVTTHSHGAAGAHTHVGVDGHTWMDPRNAQVQAHEILDACARTWPAHQKEFQDNYQKLATDLDKLDSRLSALSPALAKARILASHPAYGYIARRHAWTIETIDLPPDQPPSQEQWEAVATALEPVDPQRPTVMLFESPPLEATAKRLASQWHVASVVFDPCESLGEDDRRRSADYLTIMNENLDRLGAFAAHTSPGTDQ